MIGLIQGTIIMKSPPMLLIDVQGVGYEVEAPMTTFYQLPEAGENVQLYTHLAVREDAHLLYGFATQEERHLFRTLIKVNGVGARMALTILSGMEASEFAVCINEKDADRLTRLPGVGKKTAERLIVEMRDRLPRILQQSHTNRDDTGRNNSTDQATEDAISALIGLGYKPQEASRYVMAVADASKSSEDIIRDALKASVSR